MKPELTREQIEQWLDGMLRGIPAETQDLAEVERLRDFFESLCGLAIRAMSRPSAEERAQRLEVGNAQEAEQATAWVSVCDELSALGVPWHTGPHRSGLQGVLEELRSLVQRATQAEQSLAQERAARVCDGVARQLAEKAIVERKNGNLEAQSIRVGQSTLADQLASNIRALRSPEHAAPQDADLLESFISAVGALTDAEGILSCIPAGPERDELQQVFDRSQGAISMPFSGSMERKV